MNQRKASTIGREQPLEGSHLPPSRPRDQPYAVDEGPSTRGRYDVPMPSTRVRRPEAGMVSTTGNHASTVEWKASLLCHRDQGSNLLPSTPRHQPMVGGRMEEVVSSPHTKGCLCNVCRGVVATRGHVVSPHTIDGREPRRGRRVQGVTQRARGVADTHACARLASNPSRPRHSPSPVDVKEAPFSQ